MAGRSRAEPVKLKHKELVTHTREIGIKKIGGKEMGPKLIAHILAAQSMKSFTFNLSNDAISDPAINATAAAKDQSTSTYRCRLA